MYQRFSIILADTNQSVSGMAYLPLTPGLRSADVPLTLPLTLPYQEASRAMQIESQVIPFTYQKMPYFRPEQRMQG